MVKIGGEKRKLSKKHIYKFGRNRGKFINFAEIEGKFINFAEIGEKVINFAKIWGKFIIFGKRGEDAICIILLKGMDVPGSVASIMVVCGIQSYYARADDVCRRDCTFSL